MNPVKDYAKLKRAIQTSREDLKPFRQEALQAMRQYVGRRYGNNGSREKVPVNLMEQMISIYVGQLAASMPQVLVTTDVRSLKPGAADFEAVINFELRRMDLESTMLYTVLNAMFSMGIVKVGLEYAGSTQAMDGSLMDYGQPFAEDVNIDDWVHDTSARKWSECAFMGNRYTMFLDDAMENPSFVKAVREKLKPTSDLDTNEEGDERPGIMSRPNDDGTDYRERVELWDIWLPREKLIVTCAASNGNVHSGYNEPLRVMEWTGPEHGPYHILSFNEVPMNVMPVSPTSLMYDLHDLANRLFRKLARQAERQKTIALTRGAAKDDGETVMRANDGELHTVDDPGSTQEVNFGGANPQTMAMFLQARDMFSLQAGNLDLLGGLGAQTETVGQDELLSRNASKKVQKMQDRVLRFTQKLCRDIGWYIWTDPIRDIRTQRSIPGYQSPVQVDFSPERREGDFLDYNFDIEPYSMQAQTPGQRLAFIERFFNGFVMPLAPMMMQQGISIDFEKLSRTMAKLGHSNELEDMLIFTGPPSGMEPTEKGSSQRLGMSPQTKRTYERVNKSGASRIGQDSQMIQSMMKEQA